MYDKDFALKIVEKVKKEKKCLISEYSDLIAGVKTLKYYYINEEEKEKHSKSMISQGYELLDKYKEGLYVSLNLNSSKSENIYVTVGIYTKYNYYKPFVD